ncbi:hypothetical protein KCP70_07825 [Salmonella enterica subsp. enterica]|nr:hypothetical protein KCP70_07825 [Salmonella enterica subsp. enterica]
MVICGCVTPAPGYRRRKARRRAASTAQICRGFRGFETLTGWYGQVRQPDRSAPAAAGILAVEAGFETLCIDELRRPRLKFSRPVLGSVLPVGDRLSTCLDRCGCQTRRVTGSASLKHIFIALITNVWPDPASWREAPAGEDRIFVYLFAASSGSGRLTPATWGKRRASHGGNDLARR